MPNMQFQQMTIGLVSRLNRLRQEHGHCTLCTRVCGLCARALAQASEQACVRAQAHVCACAPACPGREPISSTSRDNLVAEKGVLHTTCACRCACVHVCTSAPTWMHRCTSARVRACVLTSKQAGKRACACNSECACVHACAYVLTWCVHACAKRVGMIEALVLTTTAPALAALRFVMCVQSGHLRRIALKRRDTDD